MVCSDCETYITEGEKPGPYEDLTAYLLYFLGHRQIFSL